MGAKWSVTRMRHHTHQITNTRFTQVFMPMVHRELASNQRGSLVHSIINDLQQISHVFPVHGGKPPVV